LLLPGNASRAEGSFLGIYKRARLQAPLEMPGNDPAASYMQSMCSTTELHPHSVMTRALSGEKGLSSESYAAFEFQCQTKRDIYWGENTAATGGIAQW